MSLKRKDSNDEDEELLGNGEPPLMDAAGAEEEPAAKRPRTEFQPEIRELLQSICDVGVMERHIAATGYDAAQAPLTEIDRNIIREGLTWLSVIEKELEKISPSRENLERLSSFFFKKIPFSGQEGSAIIDSTEKVRAKVHVLAGLADLEVVYGRLVRVASGQGYKAPALLEPDGEEQLPVGSAKPTTAFWKFITESRESLKRELGAGATLPAISKRAGELWKEMTEEQRAPWENRYRAEKDVWDKEQQELKAKEEALAWERDPLLNRQLRLLGCQIELLATDSLMWRLVAEYVNTTQVARRGVPHVILSRVFAVNRPSEEKPFAKYGKSPNRMLLWYGVHTAYVASTLMQGLKSLMPEGPNAGYSFGKGIYFSDMVGKAAADCRQGEDCSQGFLLLAEVALGRPHECVQGRRTDKLPPGCSSIAGRGTLAPSRVRVLGNGVRVPRGPVLQYKRSVQPGAGLSHNEYVVYNPALTRIRYLVEVRFVDRADSAALAAAKADVGPPPVAQRLSSKTSGEHVLVLS
mmetsp:Transcript_24017/g.39299  ORF Transcript_24017/g.39299 Transcript_24017/m.39299 type:complete len:523 (-) Transcript_24017:132-1700(-)